MGVVQFVGSGAGGAPASVTFASPVTAGHSVIVGLIVYGGTHIVNGDITGVGGDTYTLLHTPAGNAAIETQAAFFLCQSVSSGTQTISCSAHTAQAIAAWDVDDLSASAFDKSAIGIGTSAAAATAATSTLAQADERVFAIVGTDQGNSDTITQTAGEGWTFSGETEAGATDQTFNAVHKLVAATTAVSASWALAGSHNWAAAVATFKYTVAAPAVGYTGVGFVLQEDGSLLAQEDGTALVLEKGTSGHWLGSGSLATESGFQILAEDSTLILLEANANTALTQEQGQYLLSEDGTRLLLESATVTTSANANAVTATVTVTASNPTAQGAGTATVVSASVTADGFNPTATGSAAGTANVVNAPVTVAASNPAATGTGTATVVAASVTLAASNPVARGAGNASVVAAAVTAAAFNPTGKGTGNANVVAASVTLAATNPATLVPGALLYPKSVSSRKILDQNGHVILIKTMSSWGMSQNLLNADITQALEGLAAIGFNSVTATFGGPQVEGGDWHRYTNEAGASFWTGTPWASSLGAAWASVDWMLTEAARLGMFVNMSLFCGFGSTEGAGADLEARTNTDLYNAGVAIATRYLATTNIVWHVELDSSHDPASTRGQRVVAFFDGVNDTEGASTRPVRWMEPNNGAGTVTASSQGWMADGQFNATINTGYHYTDNSTEFIEGVRADVTTVPFGDCEPPYDGSGHYGGVAGQQLRERTYAVFLEGGCVVNYGQEDWWPFGYSGLFTEGLTWQAVLTHSHTLHQGVAFDLFDAYLLDTTWAATSSFLTTGEGSGDTKAAVGIGALAAIVYFPNSRTIAVDTTQLPGTGNVRLRWYDPTTGTYTSIAASEAQTAGRSITYAGNNAAGETDQVLVVDLVAVSANATVVTATVTVTAANAAGQGAGTASVVSAAVTAAATNPVARGAGNATVVAASVTAAAFNPAGQGTATAAVVAASVTVSAANATGKGNATATVVAAAVAVAATNPVAQASGPGVANPANAPVVVTASNPTATGTATASVVAASVAVAATNPAVTRLSNAAAVAASVAVDAFNPATRLTAGAQVVAASVTVTAANPAAQTQGNASAAVITATVAVAASNPTGLGVANAYPVTAAVTAGATNPTFHATGTATVVAAYVTVQASNAVAATVLSFFFGERRSMKLDPARLSKKLDPSRRSRKVT